MSWNVDPSAVVALAAATIVAATALYGHRVVLSNAKLQSKLNAATAKLQATLTANVKLAEMRQAWINSLRNDMAAFQSLGTTPGLAPETQPEFFRLGTRIELHMNPDDVEYPELQRCLHAYLGAKTQREKYDANHDYVAVCQRILKREWDVLKAEVKHVAAD